MPLTKEEIRDIAQSVAASFMPKAFVCSCGYSAVGTAHTGERLRLSIEAKDLKRVHEDQVAMYNDINEAELTCHVNLEAAREALKEMRRAAGEGEWSAADIHAVEAENSIERALYEAAKGPHNPSTKPGTLTSDDVRVEVWEERDRIHIGIQDEKTGEYLMSWWDDDARQMFEDGFFKRGSDLKSSVLEYAESMGILAK